MERQTRDSKGFLGPEGPTDYIDGATGATGPQYQSIGRTTDKPGYPEHLIYLNNEIKRLRGIENKLRKEIKILTDINNGINIKNTKLSENLNNYKNYKVNSLIINMLAVIAISIGTSMVSANFQSTLGWVFIIVGIILYLVFIKTSEYLSKPNKEDN
ncbi:MAG: hypothetical protein ACYDHX_14170 [Methanothrix sp.]